MHIKFRVLSAGAMILASLALSQSAGYAGSESNIQGSLNAVRAQSNSGLIVTTTEGVDGYKITKYIGIVRGVTVRQPTIGQSFKAGFKQIVGGKIQPFISMCETARQAAYDSLVERANQAGAQAVVGLRYDSSAFSSGSDEMGSEVVCYGTAVLIEPK
ncbi:MAG: YbjQ family protein [Candidatus Obscuribacterales bacterium]